ncbi:AAA domain-containing protein [Roseovarius sp. S4756]|uniref:AAA domain-containing protein n=1 Tax=Roseovarius maritimus TaxID=3342637 RepID=UPI00372AE3F0
MRYRLEQARAAKSALPPLSDPIALGEKIQNLVATVLPQAMADRASLGDARRQEIAESYDDWAFAAGRGILPADLARSILGTPRRIPLDDGLFDLVVFDEASQCDIATAIPLFARAKRAVVVGDDQQLSFIPPIGPGSRSEPDAGTNLPIAKMARFAQSRRSLFDFASRVPNVARSRYATNIARPARLWITSASISMEVSSRPLTIQPVLLSRKMRNRVRHGKMFLRLRSRRTAMSTLRRCLPSFVICASCSKNKVIPGGLA